MRAHRQVIFGLSWLISAALPGLAPASSIAQDEFQLVLLATPNLEHGAALYDTCAACHGPTGAGAHDGSVPAIGGQHFKVIARQLVDFRHGKRWDERMAHFANTHHLRDAQEIADVAAYANALSPAHDPDIGPGESLPQGAQVYANVCASCHGRNAEGDSVHAIPRLAGQHYEYLLKQMHDVVERRRPDYSPDHLVLFGRLQQAEFSGVADYLARMDANAR
jgi:cytochrome c553